MISANAKDGFATLAERLTARAQAIGQSWGEQQVRNRPDDPHSWRRADYLWPRFTKG